MLLNDCLHVGPTLSPLLYEILIRFRQKQIALVGDIEKTFLNIEVKLRDRDCLRFLWVENIDRDHVDPVVYRSCRVVFGVHCSPFLLNATLQYYLDTFIEIDPEFVRVMKRSFYVDDLVSERATQEAIELYDKAKTRLALGGVKLRKWLRNSDELRAEIKRNELRDGPNINKQIKNADESYAKEMLGSKEESKCERVLGLSWNCDEDFFVFELVKSASKADRLPVTKQSILKVVAVVVVVTVANVNGGNKMSNVLDISKFSRLGKLLRVTSWVKRFLFNLQAAKGGTERRVGELQGSEFADPERVWIERSQEELKRSKNYKDLERKLKLRVNDGILRCSGRLQNSEYNAQHPIIIPRDHEFTRLVIEECHRKMKHSGVRSTLGELRSWFWVPKGRQVVKKILKECVTCKKEQRKPFGTPPVAALPDFRVREATPFSKVGVDFAGPLFVKSLTGEMSKSYIALFTCCVT